MTPATRTVAGGRSRLHSRDTIIQALRDYAELYGDAFTTAAFNPSVAKWRDRMDLRERYLAGNPRTGEPWPSLNTIKGEFGGSFNAAREAAGLEANRPGPSAGAKRAAGSVAPVRDVDDRVRVVVRERVLADPGQNVSTRDLRAAERRAERAEAKLATVSERLTAARARARDATTDLAKVRGRRDRAADDLKAMREELRDVGQSLGRALDRAETAETESARLRGDLITTTEELDRVRVELERAEELRGLADPAELEAVRVEVREARGAVAAARQAQLDAERRAGEARAAQRAAETARDRAERDAAREAGLRGEMTRALAGHDRPLTAAEMDELRTRGPSGPAVFTAAVKAVARAQARGGRGELIPALREAASAAIRWADRL